MKTTEGRVLAVVATALCLAATSSVAQQKGASKPAAGVATVPVTVQNFTRAETDQYFGVAVKRGGLGKFNHDRQPTPIDKQDVVGMNRDTLYSAAVFDLDAAPVTITLPDTGKRFMSLLIVNEDHYSPAVVYAPGRYTYTKEKLGTRYMMAVVRTLIDPRDPRDIQAANAVQDAIKVEQPSIGTFEVPNWDPVSQKKIRDALIVLSGNLGDNTPPRFGWKGEIDPVMHLIVTAAGWGGEPRGSGAVHQRLPQGQRRQDGAQAHGQGRAGGRLLVDHRLRQGPVHREKQPRRLLGQQHHRQAERRRLGHGAVRRLPEGHAELHSNAPGMELHRA
jgi:hypothetical protein